MFRARLDVIAWLVVGLSMVTQAVFIGAVAWWPEASVARGGVPVPVASIFVASAFVVSGMGAFYLAVRRLNATQRGHSSRSG